MKEKHNFKERFWQLLFPRRCPFCDTVVKQTEDICRQCLRKKRLLIGPKCYRCGKGLSSSGEELCWDCKTTRHYFEKGFSLYDYETVKDSLYRFKFHDRPAYSEVYAKELRHYLAKELERLEIEAIVPIPMYAKKERERGYNQAKELARALSIELKLPLREDLIVRKKKTRPMKELGRKERQINLKNAFFVPVNDVKLKGVLLVDDIYTTGATVDACALELKKKGVQNVYYVALAIGKGV